MASEAAAAKTMLATIFMGGRCFVAAGSLLINFFVFGSSRACAKPSSYRLCAYLIRFGNTEDEVRGLCGLIPCSEGRSATSYDFVRPGSLAWLGRLFNENHEFVSVGRRVFSWLQSTDENNPFTSLRMLY